MSKAQKERARPGQQISVFLENEPGTLARVVHLLGRNHINILGLSLAEGLSHGYGRMVVDRHDDAVRLLRAAGQLVIERDVVLLDLPDEPGAFARAAERWARAGLNIEYAYGAQGPDAKQGFVVVRLNDNASALAALRRPR